MTVCSRCRKVAKQSKSAAKANTNAEDDKATNNNNNEEDDDTEQSQSVAPQRLFESRRIAALGALEPKLFEQLKIPRSFESASHSYVSSLLIAPDHVVSQYKSCGALHLTSLHRPGAVLLPNASPIISLTAVPPYVLSFHENETLQAFDAVSGIGGTPTLECAAVFHGESGAKTRALIANTRWVVVASRNRLAVWHWRNVLVAPHHSTPPALTLDMGDAADNPRDDFCDLVGHHLLFGSNQSFSVWNLLRGVCLYRFSLRAVSAAAALSSFYSMRWTGQCVVTQGKNVRFFFFSKKFFDYSNKCMFVFF